MLVQSSLPLLHAAASPPVYTEVTGVTCSSNSGQSVSQLVTLVGWSFGCYLGQLVCWSCHRSVGSFFVHLSQSLPQSIVLWSAHQVVDVLVTVIGDLVIVSVL